MFLDALSASSLSAGSGGSGATRVAENFDAFLAILTTQLQNQNPLEPLDTNQFTQQLVQFASVEQSIKQNENLERLVNLSTAAAVTGAVAFVGKRVTVQTAAATLGDDPARWGYAAAESADSAVFTVRDANGREVWSEQRSLAAGRGSYVWDGRMTGGGTAPAGSYSLTVEARKESGAAIAVTTEVEAVVDGIDFSGDEPVLVAGGVRIPVSQVRSVSG